MFVTANQIYVFLACVAFGGVGGIAFTFFYPLKEIFKNKWVNAVVDFTVLSGLAGLFVLFSLEMKFPTLMPYMFLGVFIGLIAYMKSFHIMLAKIGKKVYNVCSAKIRKFVYDRRKKKESKNSDDCRGNTVAHYTPCRNDLSDNIHKR